MFSETARKGSVPDVVNISKGPQWSPRLERKRQEDAKKGKKKEERRKTLAELALEAGYKVRLTVIINISKSHTGTMIMAIDKRTTYTFSVSSPSFVFILAH